VEKGHADHYARIPHVRAGSDGARLNCAPAHKSQLGPGRLKFAAGGKISDWGHHEAVAGRSRRVADLAGCSESHVRTLRTSLEESGYSSPSTAFLTNAPHARSASRFSCRR